MLVMMKQPMKITHNEPFACSFFKERLFREEQLDQSISAKKLLNRTTNARKNNMKKPEDERVEN